MSDNFPQTPGSGRNVATDQVTFSGDTADVQLMRPVLVTGAEGSKTVVDLTGDATNGLDVDVTRVPYATKDHDGANASGNNPVMAGLEAIAHGTNPTAVAAADVTKWYANRAGIPFVIGGHPKVVCVRLNFTAAQTNVAVVTVAAGLKIVVTGITVTLDNASTVFPSVIIGFATATTPTTTGVVLSHPGLPAGGGVSRGDGSGILGVGADDEDLRITTVGTATGGGVDVVVSYYTIES